MTFFVHSHGLILSSNAYKVLKISAGDGSVRESEILQKIDAASSSSDHQGRYCVRRPEHIFSFPRNGIAYQCFVFEPLGPSLLEFTNSIPKHPFGSRDVRWTAIYLLHAIDFLHTCGVVHTGELQNGKLGCSELTTDDRHQAR